MFIRRESFKQFIHFYPVITTLVAIQIGIWLLMFLTPMINGIIGVIGLQFPPIGNWIYQWGAGVNLLVQQGDYWRLVTPIFLHDPNGVTHVLFNSFSLVIFGPALEQMLGKVKFLSVYLLAGTIGNLFTFLMDPSAYYFSLGASGAIYGLLGLYLFMIFFEKHLIDPASAQIVKIILVVGLIMTFLRPGINIYAHIFGFIGGVALGPIFLRNVKPFSPYRNPIRHTEDNNFQFNPNRWNKKRLPIKQYGRPILWTIIVVLVVLGVFGRFL
ncbi:rhomboid family intramembrane serine protease [Aquibacillus salsiterrae]|uniref:Rhomboid family intramembrane serine protease n=1 Tax=Aquibacillus salsiterrae TaxID=2950439 RepID=A0A9X3WGJ5_9BACI|nr:rhomboid family intramembrane serine protease [Aquibacillus salsiterrae]MDC3417034.1 rhomboid family intramembrane serine protease [Aquibacillus salsiterrae]